MRSFVLASVAAGVLVVGCAEKSAPPASPAPSASTAAPPAAPALEQLSRGRRARGNDSPRQAVAPSLRLRSAQREDCSERSEYE